MSRIREKGCRGITGSIQHSSASISRWQRTTRKAVTSLFVVNADVVASVTIMNSIGTDIAARVVKPVRRRERPANAPTVVSLTDVAAVTQLRSASTTNSVVCVSRAGVVVYANTVAEWIKIVTSAP